MNHLDFGWLADKAMLSSLISALIAAAISLFVFTVGQLVSGKRSRVQFFTPKLEELYLLLNEVAQRNVTTFKLVYLSFEGSDLAKNELRNTPEVDLYGHTRAKKIIMYVQLYFPKLTRIHIHLFAAERELSNLLFSMSAQEPVRFADFQEASGRVSDFIRLMESEIVNNRNYLIGNYIFFKRFKQTSQEAIETPTPPPAGPVMR